MTKRRPKTTTASRDRRKKSNAEYFIAIGAGDDDSVSLEVDATRAEHEVSLPASPLDPLGEGLGTGGEVSIAAVDRPDREPARAREAAREARLAAGIERDS